MIPDRFLAMVRKVKRVGDGRFIALCPAHQEKTPSLSIRVEGNKILLHCFGCGAGGAEICAALGLSINDLFLDEMAPRYERSPPTAADLRMDEIAECLELMRHICDAPGKRAQMMGRKKFSAEVLRAAGNIFRDSRIQSHDVIR